MEQRKQSNIWASRRGIRRLTASTVVAGMLSAEGFAIADIDIRLEAEIPPEHSRSHIPTERTGEFSNVFVSTAASGTASTETRQVIPLFPVYLPWPSLYSAPPWEKSEELAHIFLREPLVLEREENAMSTAGQARKSTLPGFSRQPGFAHCPKLRVNNQQKRFLFKRL